ncbi:KGG domain-containing protein [Pseudomonas corrugata]
MANSGNKNPGNFANDREKASEAGKKGGQASGGNNTNDRQKALVPAAKAANAAKAAVAGSHNP